MDPRFEEIFTTPENSVFQLVFFPDRIYHAQYLNATRSPRYRYNVREVRAKAGMTVMKGEVYLDGAFLSNVLRVEYRSARIVEASREEGRLSQDEILAWIRLLHSDPARTDEAVVRLHHCNWTDCWQAEFWETLEPPGNGRHDFSVLDQMGFGAPITRVRAFLPALEDLKGLRRLELAFRENDRFLASGQPIDQPAWDNNYKRSHQEPRTPAPSSQQNTVDDQNYLIDFQRGWYLDAQATAPVRYRNAVMDADNPDRDDTGGPPDNVIEMRWLLQREFGGNVVFFHEVTIPAGKVEGTHQHIGSEELYYIVSGQGVAYMGESDDPATAGFPTVDRHIFGLGFKRCKELPVRGGHVIFTKSGGIHGIRNTGAEPLKFVAFLYQTA